MAATMTLSLEPLSEALYRIEQDDETGPVASTSKLASEDGLAIRLQRLWQERGDFSRLSVTDLEEEAAREQAKAEAGSELDVSVADRETVGTTGETEKLDEQLKSEEVRDEADQTMSPDQLWELKTTILQGLGLARSDVTSALDLLQLLLQPLGALNPPVPDEALALPSGSFASTQLHIPLVAPHETAHLTNTALSLSTKQKGVDTGASVLRNASKRLQRTTDNSQAEWTDLLRLKRAGEWRMEPARSGRRAAGDASTVQVDKLAKDICVFCGIEEAKLEWRQAGLARAVDRESMSAKGKGKEKEQDKIRLPERLEGRRRLGVTLRLGNNVARTTYMPRLVAHGLDADFDAHLLEAQQELFEEEIFAELIREARETDAYRIVATRDLLEISPNNEGFTIRLAMTSIDDLPSGPDHEEHGQSSTSDAATALSKVLSAICRLCMVRIYRSRRAEQRKGLPSRDGTKPKASKPVSRLMPTMVEVVTYHLHTQNIIQHLTAITACLQRMDVFEEQDDLYCQSTQALGTPEETFSVIEGESSTRPDGPLLGGRASINIGSHSLDFTYSSPSNLLLHLSGSSLPIYGTRQFVDLLVQGARAGLLSHLESMLTTLLAERQDWEVLPVPDRVGPKTKALARRCDPEDRKVVEFISLSPTISLTSADQEGQSEYTTELDSSYYKREQEVSVKRTFQVKSSQNAIESDAGLKAWLSDVLSR